MSRTSARLMMSIDSRRERQTDPQYGRLRPLSRLARHHARDEDIRPKESPQLHEPQHCLSDIGAFVVGSLLT